MLSGEIPSEFGALDELYWLDLEKNELNGAIPVALADMSSLQALLIGNNKLKGPIPSGLGNAPALAWLDLSSNELSGGIPDAVGNLSNLARLWINDNSELEGALSLQP